MSTAQSIQEYTRNCGEAFDELSRPHLNLTPPSNGDLRSRSAELIELEDC